MENFNMNFSQRVTILGGNSNWIESPSSGVRRIPLERESAESGHVTSLVEYLPGSRFSEHDHPLGEEILVLKGTFSDEAGDYPAGTYIRNPPGTAHAPFSKEGCVIFVKLNQFQESDLERVVINTLESSWRAGHGNLQVLPLHSFGTESCALVKWPEGEEFLSHTHMGGEEILVISGEFKDEFGSYPQLAWLRSPHGSIHKPYVEKETLIYVKTGHLPA